MREHKWSLDACFGSAKLHRLFEPSEMICSCTLYNWVWANLIPLKVIDLLDALRRKISKSKKPYSQMGKEVVECGYEKRKETQGVPERLDG